MILGFSDGLSPAGLAMRDQLHAIARNDLRALAAQAEQDGLDLKLLAQHLDTVGMSPATLLSGGLEDPHLLLTAVEELSYGDAAIAWAAVPALQLAIVLNAAGSTTQRQRIGDVFAHDGAATVRVLMYEDFGRQPSEFQTRITSAGDDWIVNGHKSSVAHPANADVSLLVGTDGDELAAFCFVGDRAGLSADRDDREVGKIGINAVSSGPVTIAGLPLAADERLTGGIALHRAVGQARLLLAAALVGLARASVEYCSAYALQRTTWGTPLAQHEGVSLPLVELATEIEVVRLLLWDVAASLPGRDDVADIERKVTRAVNRASSLGLRATRDGVQLVGVRAITRDMPCERWYRHAAVLGAIDFDLLETPFGLS